MDLNGKCNKCKNQASVIVNGQAWCLTHIDDAFSTVRQMLDTGLAVLNEREEHE